jgi:hypothetical protein
MAEINTTQMRDALAWATGDENKAKEPSTNPFVWFWEAVEGDFNENRSTAQIMVDAGISMIPLVDQVCDVRDLIANCKKLVHDFKDTWAWVALVLTLIGLFPTLGSLVKGVLKIFFGFVRRSGGRQISAAVEGAMTWVISFLRRRDVQKYLKAHKVDQVFNWLATNIRGARGKINTAALLAAFDKGIGVLEGLVNKVKYVPSIGGSAKNALEEVKRVRLLANEHLGKALKPVQDIIDTIILRLEREALETNHGIVNVANVHYRGPLPESAAVTLMRDQGAPWLSKEGDKFYDHVEVESKLREVIAKSAKKDANGLPRPEKDIFPNLSRQSIESFHTLEAYTIHGPARLYRVLAPNSRAMSDCWMTEEVFKRLKSADNPKHAWRRFLAVWPDWNVNGQFVIYDVKAGETLNTWRGIAASQEKAKLPGKHLEGGYEQIVFNVERADPRNDTLLYYPVKGRNGEAKTLGKPLSQDEYNALKGSMSDTQKAEFDAMHLGIRQNINHPNISGPFETGWGYNEFDGTAMASKLGLPALPGQITK